jgi:tRNA threonylcarbamoyl adenosine modification protein YeaZ
VLILAFDTSSPAVTVALVEVRSDTPPSLAVVPGERIVTFGSVPQTIAERCEVANNRHGELLAPSIEAVLRDAGAQPADLCALAVGLGPGPFTGLRVGVVTARAMSDSLGIPAYGECSLDVIAHELGLAAGDDDEDIDRPYVVMSDARRKQVYWARYDGVGIRVGEPDIGRPDEVAEQIRDNVSHVAGAGAALYRDAFADFTLIERSPYPAAAALASMVAVKVTTRQRTEELVPLYLRRPDAQPPGKPKAVTPS